MTMLSRIFGYLRDMVIAVTFGATGSTDAFFVAFRIPNFLRRLFAEGAFAQAFVPVFAEYQTHRSPAELKDLVDHTVGTLLVVLVALTGLGVVAAPLLITLFAPGFAAVSDQHALAAAMLRLTLPYLLFISLTALAGSILNSLGRFAVPAFTPVLLNLALIGAALWLAPQFAQPIMALAWGVLFAGIAQLGFQLPFLVRQGLLPRPRWQLAHTGVRRIVKLMLPAIFGSSVVQINLLFGTLIASLLASGSISWLYYADRFVELPLALTGIALGTVILPKLSRQQAMRDLVGFNATLNWGLRLGVLVGIPAMLGLLCLNHAILATLVQYGAFTATDTHMTGLVLSVFSLGLPAFIAIKILAPGFYSQQDTATPVQIGIVAMLANMALTVVVVGPWVWFGWDGAHAGLAIATALAAYLNAFLLLVRLRRCGGFLPAFGWMHWILRVAVAGLVMTALLLWWTPPLRVWTDWSVLERVWSLFILIGAGGACYVTVLVVLGLRPRHLGTDAMLDVEQPNG